MLSFKLAFSLSSFTVIERLLNSSLLSAIRVVSSAYLWLLILIFNSYSEYIMRNARLDEAQAGIQIVGEISL